MTMPFDYSHAPYPIRADIPDAYRTFWHRLACPGNWWTGLERIAIAQEVRNAADCDFCRRRKAALSPYTVAGEHDHSGALPAPAMDAVHRIITDQGRITRRFVDDLAEAGISDGHYVELVGIAVAVFSIDEFNRALGIDLEILPAAEAGAPDHYRPPLAEAGTGFVPMLPVDGAVGEEADLWEEDRTANVLRALTLAPNALRDWLSIGAAQYLSIAAMANFTGQADRALDRMQMELVAARVSSYNECFY